MDVDNVQRELTDLEAAYRADLAGLAKAEHLTPAARSERRAELRRRYEAAVGETYRIGAAIIRMTVDAATTRLRKPLDDAAERRVSSRWNEAREPVEATGPVPAAAVLRGARGPRRAAGGPPPGRRLRGAAGRLAGPERPDGGRGPARRGPAVSAPAVGRRGGRGGTLLSAGDAEERLVAARDFAFSGGSPTDRAGFAYATADPTPERAGAS